MLKAIPLMQAGEMEKLALLLSVLCPGVERGAVISTAIASTSAASTTLTLPILPPWKSSFGISLPRANHKGKQSPQIKCAPYRLTIRGHSSNSCHQDYKHGMFLWMYSWLIAVPARSLGSNRPALYEVKNWPSADRPGTSATPSTPHCWRVHRFSSFKDGIT